MPTATDPNVPLSYTVPSFPSLYWPINTPRGQAVYLYYQSDIWRFTLYWTLIAYGAVHVVTSLWAVLMQIRDTVETGKGIGERRKMEDEVLRRERSNDDSDEEGAGVGSVGVEGEEIEMMERRRKRSGSRERIRRRRKQGPKEGEREKGSKRREAWSLRWVWLIPLVYLVIGSIEALMAGSIVGLILGTVYEAGYFKMSTWTPLVWALVNVLTLILSGFSIQGGL